MAPIFGAPPRARKSDRTRQRCALCITSPALAAHNRRHGTPTRQRAGLPAGGGTRSSCATCAPSSRSPKSSTSRAPPTGCTCRSRRLSRQISSLEKLIGCSLLRRSTHRVELTLAGEALLERTHRLLEDVNEAITRTQSVGGELAFRLTQYWAPVFATAEDGISLAERRAAIEGAVRAVPAAAGVGGRARQRGRRALVSHRPGPVPAGHGHVPARRSAHVRLRVRPPRRDRRPRRRRRPDGPRARVPARSRAPLPGRPRGRRARLRLDDRRRRGPQPDRDRGRLVRRRPGDGAAAQAARGGQAAARRRRLVLPVGRHHGEHAADRRGAPIRSPRRWRAWCSRSPRATSGTARSTSRC